jgi:hypothetical protein
MGRFKRKSKKRYAIPKDAVKQYIEDVKEKKPKSKFTIWTTPANDNRRLIGLFRKLFLVLKKNKRFGDFIECYYPIENRIKEDSVESVRKCISNYGHGRSSLLIGKNFLIPVSRDLLTTNSILNTPIGNVIWLDTLLESNWYHKRQESQLYIQEIAELYLKDAYKSKGITKSKFPNEMAFSMRIGTILAIIFYLVVTIMLALFLSPLTALFYSLFTALTIIYFLFSFQINDV